MKQNFAWSSMAPSLNSLVVINHFPAILPFRLFVHHYPARPASIQHHLGADYSQFLIWKSDLKGRHSQVTSKYTQSEYFLYLNLKNILNYQLCHRNWNHNFSSIASNVKLQYLCYVVKMWLKISAILYIST